MRGGTRPDGRRRASPRPRTAATVPSSTWRPTSCTTSRPRSPRPARSTSATRPRPRSRAPATSTPGRPSRSGSWRAQATVSSPSSSSGRWPPAGSASRPTSCRAVISSRWPSRARSPGTCSSAVAPASRAYPGRVNRDGSRRDRPSRDGPSRAGQQKGSSPPSRDRRARRDPDHAPPDTPRPGTTRMFATVVPGLAALVTSDLEQLPGVHVTGAGFDGRSDVILFEVDRGGRPGLRTLRTIESLFAEVGRTTRSGGDSAPGIAARLWRPDGVQRALSAWAADVRPLSGAMTYRVVAQAQQEQAFLRIELRRGLTRAIGQDRPRWNAAGPAQLEVWVSEYAPGRLVAGLRLLDASRRPHEGWETERPG